MSRSDRHAVPIAHAPVDVLLVEDSAADAELTREALVAGDGDTRLHEVRDGIEALAFLRRVPPFEAAPRPVLILLDLNLPRMDGRMVLAEIKRDPALRSIPVVVLTSSAAEQDVMAAYDLNANCYVTKPLNLDDFLAAVRAVRRFWLSTAALPPNAA